MQKIEIKRRIYIFILYNIYIHIYFWPASGGPRDAIVTSMCILFLLLSNGSASQCWLIFRRMRLHCSSSLSFFDATLFCQTYESVVIARPLSLSLAPLSLFPSLLFFLLSFSPYLENPPAYKPIGRPQPGYWSCL